jgi:hypothetical protein
MNLNQFTVKAQEAVVGCAGPGAEENPSERRTRAPGPYAIKSKRQRGAPSAGQD